MYKPIIYVKLTIFQATEKGYKQRSDFLFWVAELNSKVMSQRDQTPWLCELIYNYVVIYSIYQCEHFDKPFGFYIRS